MGVAGTRLAAIAGVVASGVAIWVWRSRTPSSGLTLSGVVEAREIQVGSKVGGRVSEVLVREGDLVEPQQVLVRFEAPELIAEQRQWRARVAAAEAVLARFERGYRAEEIAQAEAAVARDQAALQALREGPRPQEIAQGRADLAAAEAEAKNAASQFARIEQLHKTGDVAQQALDDARARRDLASERVHAAGQRLALLEAGTRDDDIRAAEARVRQSEAQAQMLRRGFRKEDIADARAKAAEARAALDSVNARAAEAEVRAPAKSRIEAVSVRPGDLVPPGRAIATLLELSQLWVRIYVPEPALGSVKAGQQVGIAVDSHPGRTFPGVIEQINHRAEFLPRNIQTRDDRNHQVFGAKIRVDNSEGVFKAGMAATAHVPPN